MFSINVVFFVCVLSHLLMTNVQFNYMHECFERVFCELKWRKEVKRKPPPPQKRWFKPDICVLGSYLRRVSVTDRRRGHRQGQ